MKLTHYEVLKSDPKQAQLVFFDKVKGFSTIALQRQFIGRKVISPK